MARERGRVDAEGWESQDAVVSFNDPHAATFMLPADAEVKVGMACEQW